MAIDPWVSQNRTEEARRVEEAALASKYGPFGAAVGAARAMKADEEARRRAYILEASGVTPPSREAAGKIGGAAAAAPDDGSYARKELARARSVSEGFTGSDLSKLPVITNMGFGITKRSAPGKTTEYSNIDPTTGRPRAYAAPYVAADGTPTSDWTKTAAYAEGIKRAEKDQVEAALLDIGEAARTQSGAAGERERAAAIARTRLRLDPTGGAAARRAEVATGVTEQQMAQAARLNQLQAQYLAETDPAKQAQIGATLMTLAGKAQPEEFKLEAIQQGEVLGGPENMPVPLKQAALPVLVGSRGTVRTVPTGAGTGAPRGINAPPKDLKDFLAKARPVNPGMSDAELTKQYNALYGKK
jgi:hypothetical protein